LLFATAATAQERAHPNPRYIADIDAPVEHVKLSDVHDPPPWVTRASEVLRLGALDGPTEEVFGEVRHVLIWEERVHILDGQSQSIRVFTLSGDFLQEVGGPGEGPGEFRHPQAMARLSNGDLVVSDLRRQFYVFRPSGDSLIFHETWHSSLSPTHLCSIGDTLYGHAVRPDSPYVIHGIQVGGRVVASFGEIYNSDSQMANFQIRQGRIACDLVHNHIIYGPGGALGELRVFRGDGAPVRRVVVSDFRPIDLISDGSRTRVTVPDGGFHGLNALEPLPAGGFWAQYASRDRAGIEFQQLHTLTIETNRVNGVRFDHSLVAATESYFVVVEAELYPVVRVFRY
jgi:hypothetical protein